MKNKKKTPTIMISRQNGDFLAFFSEQVSLFFGSYISFTNCTSCLDFSTNDDHNVKLVRRLTLLQYMFYFSHDGLKYI